MKNTEETEELVTSELKNLTGSNSIFAIRPFFKEGMWVFNDSRTGLQEEPFIAGADEFIEHELKKKKKLDEGKGGFNLIFSTSPFLGFQYELSLDREDSGGCVYTVVNVPDFSSSIGDNQLWLCPALNLYFPESPGKLYVAFKI